MQGSKKSKEQAAAEAAAKENNKIEAAAAAQAEAAATQPADPFLEELNKAGEQPEEQTKLPKQNEAKEEPSQAQQQAQTSWEEVDTEDVEFVKLEAAGEEFIGRFKRSYHSENPLNPDWPRGEDKFDGVGFVKDGSITTYLLPARYQLYAFFVNKEYRSASGQPVDFSRNPLFRVVAVEQVDAKVGKVWKHSISFKYDNK